MPPPTEGCCAHDHDCGESDCGPAFSLYKHIDLPQVRCLNEELEGSCRGVFRPWDERLQPVSVPLRSNEGDPDLLLHIPFDGAVKLMAICVIGGSSGSAPSTLKAYTNREGLDFSTLAALPPVQEWTLQDDTQGVLEYPTQVAKFNGVHTLDLFFSGTFGADASELHFVGLKGDFSERQRRAVEAVYESQAMAKDHKVPGTGQGADWTVG